ncbi:MAG: chitobiase/beta-hexosaminidase C-terminal domain-containing protein, partial [Acetivibrio ethanolgignens]
MKAFYKKCLAALLTVAMILSMIPASVFAVQQTGTYSKISGVADLTSGKYVLVCENNRAAGAYDTDTKALPEQEQSVVENSIINPAESLVWNVVVSGSSISLQDSKGKYLTSGGNSSNSISAENTPYYWKVLGGTTFTFNEETGTKVLAYNTNTKYFRQYAATGTNPKNFTLYKFVEGSIAPATQADEPKASQPSGVVVKGTKIALTCSTADSTIYYKLSKETEEWQTYSTEIVIDEATTIYAKAGATAAGLKESEVVTFAYTVPTMPPEVKDDPITSIPDGAISIEDALKAPDGETVTVVGQLVYRFGNYNNTNSAILEDVVGGQVVALQIYNSLDDYQIGDILKITAKKETRSGVIQISSASKIEVVTKAEEAKLIPAQEFNSIVELLASKEYLLSEWVKIKNITLNTYNSNGNTQITDSFGNTMAVYRAAAYPYGVEPGEVVDVYACVSKYNKTDQLRLGSSRDYVVVNDTKAPNIEFESTELKAGLLQDLNITVAIRDNVGVKEAKLAYTAGSNQPVELSLKQDTEDRVKWKGTIPGAVFVAGVDKVTVKVFAEDVNGNKGEESVAVKVID